MMTNRARMAMMAVDHYPDGDVLEWARRNWRDAVCPYMDEFIAAVKNKNAPVAEEYFNDNSPAFLFTDVKVMDGMACGMRGLSPRDKSAIVSEVFGPFGQKWSDLLSAFQRRIGACTEVRSFMTSLSHVADSIKLMFVETGIRSYVDDVWQLRQSMIDSFGALRERVCSAAAKDLARTPRARYCKSNEELAELFGVTVKTITRWKNENNQTPEARKFRMVRESEHGMELAAAEYKRLFRLSAGGHGRVRVAYNDAVDINSRRIDR